MNGITLENFPDWFFSIFDPRWAQIFGFISFFLICLYLLIRLIAWGFRALRQKAKPTVQFTIDDVNHVVFKKKGYLTFDLYIANASATPLTILQTGFVLSDGSEIVIRDENENTKKPDKPEIEPGETAFFDNCDFYYTILRSGIIFKKIERLFVDVRGIGRVYGETNINPLLNDHQIREILTDAKGLHGF